MKRLRTIWRSTFEDVTVLNVFRVQKAQITSGGSQNELVWLVSKGGWAKT